MRNPIFLATILLASFQMAALAQQSKLTLIPLFSDHMVLQQKQNVAIWGASTPKSKIYVAGSWGKKATATADENGDWMLQLATPAAGGPHELTISTKDTAIILKDVMSGEVWLASGQSNMDMPLKGYPPNELIDNYKEEIAAADYPNIRFFDVAKATARSPLKNRKGQWKISTPEQAGDFSATAYFFARKLYQELKVPIGIISSTWRGTSIESWIDRDKLLELGEFESEIKLNETIDSAAIQNFLQQFPVLNHPTDSRQWYYFYMLDSLYSKTDFADSSWQVANLPHLMEDLNSKTGIDGTYWFRKKVQIDNLDSDYTLLFDSSTDDADMAFFNGQKIGSTFCQICTREYAIPKALLNLGENIIAIRIIDTGGPGGLNGKMLIKDETGKEIQLSGEWRYLHIADLINVNWKRRFYMYHLNPKAMKNIPDGLNEKNILIGAGVPGTLFNNMINPLIPYTIKGVIWYQGEGNVGRAEQYAKLFPVLIEDWRQRWKNDFPFYFVQIAPSDYRGDKKGQSPLIREIQRKSLTINKTAMAITLDIGLRFGSHPGNKQAVGDRLAKLALAKDYGKKITANGPLYKTNSLSENKMILEFDNIGSGLMAKNEQLSDFEIAGADKKFVQAKAFIVDNKIEVSSPAVRSPQYARYAWKDYVDASLFNNEGLPASSFTTEE